MTFVIFTSRLQQYFYLAKSMAMFKLCKLFLLLIFIHSLLIGLLMVCLPTDFYTSFGLSISHRFFVSQNGILHIALSLVYLYTHRHFLEAMNLLGLVFLIKLLAALFLFTFCIYGFYHWIALVSGIGDLLMALAALFFYLKCNDTGH